MGSDVNALALELGAKKTGLVKDLELDLDTKAGDDKMVDDESPKTPTAKRPPAMAMAKADAEADPNDADDEAGVGGAVTPNEEDEQGGAVTRWLMGGPFGDGAAAAMSSPSRSGLSRTASHATTDTDLTSPSAAGGKRAASRARSSSLESYVSGYSPAMGPSTTPASPPTDLWRPFTRDPEHPFRGYAPSSPSTMSSTDLAHPTHPGIDAVLGLRHWSAHASERDAPARSVTDAASESSAGGGLPPHIAWTAGVGRAPRASISTARPPESTAASPLIRAEDDTVHHEQLHELHIDTAARSETPRADALGALRSLSSRPALAPLWSEIAASAARCSEIIDDAVLASAGVLPPVPDAGSGPSYDPGARAVFRLLSRLPADAGMWGDIRSWAGALDARLGHAEAEVLARSTRAEEPLEQTTKDATGCPVQ